MEFKEHLHEFPSGLKLAIVESKGFYTSKFKIIFNVGAEDEEQEYGISHLIEHCTFKGTQNLTQEQISSRFDSLSASVNASTSSEFTSFKAKFPNPNLEEVLKLYSTMIFDSIYKTECIEKEKNVIIEEIKMYEDMPDEVAFENLIKLIYSGTGISNAIAGKIELLKSVTREDIINYKNKHYTAPNAVISVVGDYDSNEVIKLVDKYFNEPLKKAGEYTKVWSKPSRKRGGKIIKRKDTNQANIFLGYKSLPYENLDRLKLGLILYILGGNMSSRLYKRLRNELSLCYNVYSFNINYKNNGFLGVSVATSPEKSALAIKEIKNEIHKIMVYGVTDEEFNSAKNLRLNKLLMDKDIPGVALTYLAYTGKLLDNKMLEQIVKNTTKEDALNVFRKYINEDEVFISYVGKKPTEEI